MPSSTSNFQQKAGMRDNRGLPLLPRTSRSSGGSRRSTANSKRDTGNSKNKRVKIIG